MRRSAKLPVEGIFHALCVHALRARAVVVVEAGCDEERLFKALQKLQELASPVRQDADFQDLLKKPTVERLEAFLALKKLLEEKRTS
jgi:F0F1-type ATP synthase delta subunit